jgi:carbamoyltransferase
MRSDSLASRRIGTSGLAEGAGEYFEGCRDARYMILTLGVPEKRGVTHADNTARVPTVSRHTNSGYWTLIGEFAALTGVPVVTNSSVDLRDSRRRLDRGTEQRP